MSRLPPFFALRALEAAARHRSYSRAAEELSVTHGAVSQQIRRLETELGERLFERRGNRMEPAPKALRLAGEVARALEILRDGVTDFTGAAARDPLVLSIGGYMAQRWLPPRLPRLLADPAGANLEIRVENRHVDLVAEGVDVGLRYGTGEWADLQSLRLFAENLFPVCSPSLAAAHAIATPRDLLAVPLLDYMHRPWTSWFANLGLDSPPAATGLVFDDHIVALEAAAQGLGVALGINLLVEDDLRSGRLIRLLDASAVSDLGIYMVWRADSPKLARILALQDWLVAEIASGEPSAGPPQV